MSGWACSRLAAIQNSRCLVKKKSKDGAAHHDVMTLVWLLSSFNDETHRANSNSRETQMFQFRHADEEQNAKGRTNG